MNCKETQFQYPRFGTEQVLEILRAEFANVRIERFDSDVLSTARKLEACLQAFNAGEISVLVGTQMLAKGHDFSRVRLMIILYPERTLLLPDFRSYERVYRELVQASGRAGRAERRGEVFIETTFARDPLFRLVREGRFDDFYEDELVKRKASRYPPFTKLIRFVIRGAVRAEVSAAALKVRQLALIYLKASLAARKTELIGPSPCLIAKLKRNYRYHLIIKTTVMQEMFPLFQTLMAAPFARKKVFIELDIDPTELF